MARADLLKKLLQSHQRGDDQAFREAADEIVQDERKKHHVTLARELERILKNGSSGSDGSAGGLNLFEPLPLDSDRRAPLLDIRQPDACLADLVLDDAPLLALQRIIREFCAWEVLEANGLQPVRRVLFCGPSGCGKTSAAAAIAGELSLPLLYVRFDSVVSSLLGETASNLRRVFDYARRGQWVILFDEFDAIGRSRDDVTEHGEIKRVVNSLLQMIDAFGGRSLIIAATNFEQSLDPAVWRRFDEVVRFGMPAEVQIAALAKKRLKSLQVPRARIDRLAENLRGATFADAERVCLDVRKLCVLRGDRVVTDSDLDEALERHLYRRSVQQSALSGGAPAIDRE